MSNKNLITGPGFVASHLADLLVEKGEEVYITYRWTDNQESFTHIKDKVNWVLMDLNDYKSCQDVILKIRPDYIFHLGAQSYVPASFVYPSETLQTNIIGTYNLLEAVKFVRDLSTELVNQIFNHDEFSAILKPYVKYDPTIHVCSSSEVYGLVDESLIPITEECRFNPSNPYAVGKVGEDMVALLYYTNYGLKTIRTRMFTHTGPRRTMLSAEVAFAKQIAEFEKEYKKQQEGEFATDLPTYFLKHGNLNSIRTWADVRDACKAYYILVRKGKPGEVYNIGGDTSKDIGEMLDYLISLSPLKDKIIKEVDKSLLRNYDVTLQIPDCSKFKKLGWNPEISFEKTMKDLLNFWRDKIKNEN